MRKEELYNLPLPERIKKMYELRVRKDDESKEKIRNKTISYAQKQFRKGKLNDIIIELDDGEYYALDGGGFSIQIAPEEVKKFNLPF